MSFLADLVSGGPLTPDPPTPPQPQAAQAVEAPTPPAEVRASHPEVAAQPVEDSAASLIPGEDLRRLRETAEGILSLQEFEALVVAAASVTLTPQRAVWWLEHAIRQCVDPKLKEMILRPAMPMVRVFPMAKNRQR